MIKTRVKAKPVDTPPNDQGGDPLWVEVANDQRVDIEMVGREMVVSPHAPKAGRGRPASGKVVVSIRLDPAVIAKFKATGDGWQARINDVLMGVKV